MRTRIALDTDVAMGAPGSDIDDGFAIALAAADPDIQLELITTVAGNTDVRSASALALNLLQRLDRAVPVVQGAAGPLMDPWRACATTVADTGPGPAPGRAAVAIADLVLDNPGQITLVAIGPLTNIATAMLLEPRVAAAAQRIVIMGGYFFGHQNDVRVPGEFNVWADPEAARIVLGSGADLSFVGLDVTYRVRMSQEQAASLARSQGAFGAYAGRCALGWIDILRERYPHSKEHGSFALHDPLAVAAVTRPQLLQWQDAHVEVALDGVARGITIADTLGTRGAPAANCRIASGVDAPAFLDHLMTTISAC